MKLGIEQPLLNSRVSIHAPVAQKWPVRPMFVDAIPFDVGRDNLFSIHRTFCDDFSAWRSDKTLPPKLDAVATGGGLLADPLCGRDVTPIRNRVTAINCFQWRILRRTEFIFFARMPAD